MDDVKRYDVQGKFESTNGEGISLLNPKMVLEQDYDAKCHAAEVYFGSWKRTEQELDAQRLRADTAEAELKAIKESMAYRGSLFGQVQAQRDSAEQRIASIAGEPAKCKECGSDALFWFDSNTNTSGIMEGRLRTNEITCTFVLGCADCSATIKTVRAETIAARMTAALNPKPEAGSQSKQNLFFCQ